MYGIGSGSAALIAGRVLVTPENWVWLFAGASAPLVVLLLWFATSRSIRETPTEPAAAVQTARLSFLQMILLLAFAAYVGGEVLCSMWMTVFLTEARGYSIGDATSILSGFFICMALSRLLCLFIARPAWDKQIIAAGLTLGLISFVVGVTVWPPALAGVGLIGPFFPLMLAKGSQAMPDRWRSTIIWIISAMQVTLAAMHFSVGNIADQWGIGYAYMLSGGLLFAACGLAYWFFRAIARTTVEPSFAPS